MVGDDRGQLILVGAVAIAIIVVGLVLVVNTALFTEVVGSEGTVEVAKDSGAGVQSLEDAVSAVVHNASADDSTSTTYISSLVEDELQPALINRSVDSHGTYVSVDYAGQSEGGTYVTTGSSGTFEPTRTFVQDAEIGHFVLVVDRSSSSGDMQITVDDGNSTRTLYVDESAGGLDLSGADQRRCQNIDAPESDVVRLDLYHGTAYEQPQCTFDLFAGLERPYTVESSGADSFHGSFEYVTNESTPSGDVSDLEWNPAVWSFTLEYQYHTDEVTASGEREVRVYD